MVRCSKVVCASTVNGAPRARRPAPTVTNPEQETKMRILAQALCTGLIGCALIAGAGCNKPEGQGTTKTTSGDPARPADNTGINERDKGGATMLPTDQSENPMDRDITAGVRKQVVGDENLSMQAKNVKIITTGQVVTLRGPVKSEAEKKAIGEYAARAPNVKRVDNQLEVETK
jgi:hypothetical protein